MRLRRRHRPEEAQRLGRLRAGLGCVDEGQETCFSRKGHRLVAELELPDRGIWWKRLVPVSWLRTLCAALRVPAGDRPVTYTADAVLLSEGALVADA